MSIGIRHIVCNRMKLQITPGEQKNISHPVDDQQRVRANKTKLYFCECDQNYQKRKKAVRDGKAYTKPMQIKIQM